ncbi:alpha-1,2-fucosyltransferase [Francisella sp. XLW-1]|uniref:alpha-1,2-fucosyltransferase n=1 Tax=Francisella sp. XLW-1 TaxID=2610887 RepID=UPI00123E2212|nr:alpha-1,2-fucosyltransferase [Francisella sp. XLW-1]
MIIVKIVGGLGNQMFQYAYARALESRGYDVKIDISEFSKYKLHGGYQLNRYGISIHTIYDKKSYFQKIRNKIIKKFYFIKEESLDFDTKYLNLNNKQYVEGYFQSERYFIDIRNILLKEFIIQEPLSKYTRLMEEKISKNKSCSVHIRRGDYTSDKNINVHGVCSIDYYMKAIDIVNSYNPCTNFFIFSDDIVWCKKFFNNDKIFFVDNHGRVPHEDIYLMSLCNNNIIANSSFSWWGAWINQDDNKIVIAPKNWFAATVLQEQSQDIVCDGWLKI